METVSNALFGFLLILLSTGAEANPTGQGQKVIIIGTGVDGAAFPLAYEACFSTDNFFWNPTCPDGTTEQVGPGAGAPYDLTVNGLHDTRVAAIVDEMAPDADLMAFQVYSRHKSNGLIVPFHADTIRALDHALLLAQQGEPIAAVVLAQGGSTIYTDSAICAQNAPGIEDLGNALKAEGVQLVVSAGNTLSDSGLVLPAICNGNIAISALVWGIPYGSHGPQSELFADGVTFYGGQRYEGSSYASPRVAATIALQKESDPNRTPDENLAAMIALGTPFPVPTYGTKPELTHGPDPDSDGALALFDNCTAHPNPMQDDADEDGIGNRCDCDFNQDGFCGGLDFTVFVGCYGLSAVGPNCSENQLAVTDMDGNGIVDSADYSTFMSLYNGPPGPSGRIQ